MIIKNNRDVPESRLSGAGIRDVLRKILIGPEDGSERIIMRLFTLLPQGTTPFPSHSFEHVGKVEKGRGVVVNAAEEEIRLEEGRSLFFRGGEKHRFRNPYDEPFSFICIIPNPDKPT